MILVFGTSCRIRRGTSNPFMSGIHMSRTHHLVIICDKNAHVLVGSCNFGEPYSAVLLRSIYSLGLNCQLPDRQDHRDLGALGVRFNAHITAKMADAFTYSGEPYP